jgi:hypothetical protein
MPWRQQLNANSLPWLLETESPGVRYLALRDLVGGTRPEELHEARGMAHERGPIAEILGHMQKEGYWVKPGPGYSPKYHSTVWSIITLAQLGASVDEDPRVAKACDYILDQMAQGGQFSTLSSGASSGTVDCLQGNLCWSLLEMGCTDPRLDVAFDWMARTVTGEGMLPANPADAAWRRGIPLPTSKTFSGPEAASTRRYYAYKSGPDFACGMNGGLPCAWGAAKVMMALATLPRRRQTPAIKNALRRGVQSFRGVDPVTALYPHAYGDRPNPNWWKFGFPVFYVTDLLQWIEAAGRYGYGRHPSLKASMEFIRGRQNAQGRWSMDYDYLRGKLWVDFGPYKQPNKWVTLRALRVLKLAAGY